MTIKQLQSLIKSGQHTPESLADLHGLLIEEGCVLPSERSVWASDGVSDIDMGDVSQRQAARDFVCDGGYEKYDSTYWVTVYTYRLGVGPVGDVVKLYWMDHTIAIEPEEPDCTHANSHSWKDGPVHGSGGGVYYTDTCRHCSLRRTRDTWAQNPDTGEQGLDSTCYTRD